jgi:hypothetical protein
MFTSKEVLEAEEAQRLALRRVLGALADHRYAERIRQVAAQRSALGRGAAWVPCPELGRAVFAITARGMHVGRELGLRLDRFREAKLGTFLAQLDKADAKMAAFSQQVAATSNEVGYVRKGKAHVVVGLVKSGLPAEHAVGLYRQALAHTQAADVAATCARNAAQAGGTTAVHRKLAEAYEALRRAGFPAVQPLQGAAKSLLPYEPVHAGVPRYTELFQWLRAAGAGGDDVYKFASRLMPAQGAPADVVHRAQRAAHRLSQAPNAVKTRNPVLGRTSVALASMVGDDRAVDALCDRFLEIERGLVRAGLANQATAGEHAVECVGCAGAPAEVVATVNALAFRLAGGGRPEAEHVTIAAAFAKRFAY